MLGGFHEPGGEATVVAQTARREHLAGPSRHRQRRGVRPQIVGETTVEAVDARKLEVVAVGAEHGGTLAAERLGRGLRDGVERRLCGQRLAQHGRNPVEATLDLRLPRALLVRLGIAERDRCQARERFDQPEIRLVELIRVARADSEDPQRLPERQDRRVHHLVEDRVVLRRGRLLGRAEVTTKHRPAGGDCLPDRADGGDPAADLGLG